MLLRTFCLAVALLCATSTNAAELRVRLHDRTGQPLLGAVVSMTFDSRADGVPPPAWTDVVVRCRLVEPQLSVARAGDWIRLLNASGVPQAFRIEPVGPSSFPLRAAVARAEEVPVSERDAEPFASVLRVPLPGLYRISAGEALGYVYVVDASAVATTDERGAARFGGIPQGRWTLHVWHPDAHVDVAEIPVVIDGKQVVLELEANVAQRSVGRPLTPSADPASSDF
jgi:hypothetical protein